MSHSTSESGASSPIFRPIHLKVQGTAILVDPQDHASGDISATDAPIALPPLPKSMGAACLENADRSNPGACATISRASAL
jgi:hypothetical protein